MRALQVLSLKVINGRVYLEVGQRVHFHLGHAAVRVSDLDHHRELGRRHLQQTMTLESKPFNAYHTICQLKKYNFDFKSQLY